MAISAPPTSRAIAVASSSRFVLRLVGAHDAVARGRRPRQRHLASAIARR
jgi:hypothetical protein